MHTHVYVSTKYPLKQNIFTFILHIYCNVFICSNMCICSWIKNIPMVLINLFISLCLLHLKIEWNIKNCAFIMSYLTSLTAVLGIHLASVTTGMTTDTSYDKWWENFNKCFFFFACQTEIILLSGTEELVNEL